MSLFRDYAFIALGANLPSAQGSPRQTLEAAALRLQALSAAPLLLSSFIHSKPLDCPPGSPDFVNAVAGILPLPDETPLSLLHKLQALEAEAGRQRSGLRNEARVLDLDLLSFGMESMDTDELVLPHPRARERDFVLRPLAELAGDEIFPGSGRTVRELLAAL